MLSLLVSIVVLVLTWRVSRPVNPWWELVAELPLWACFVGAALVASHRHGTGSLAADFGLATPRAGDIRLGTLGGLLGRVVPLVYFCLWLLAVHLDHVSNVSSTVLGITPNGISAWIVLVLLTVVGAPMVEELFFRGLVQGAFSRRVGPRPALFVTATIFSLAHVPGEGPFAPYLLFPMAVVLGYLRMRTGRLAAGMVAHAEFNAIGILLAAVPAFH